MERKFSKDNLMRMQHDLLRAVIRERTHHTLEFVVDQVLQGRCDVPGNLGDQVESFLEVWTERGFDTHLPDIIWSKHLLQAAKYLKAGKRLLPRKRPPRPFSKKERLVVKRLIATRRSVRSFTDRKVPRWAVKSIILAGIWAPSSCNLQTIRVLIVDDEELSLFTGGESPGAKVRLAVCQDSRPYELFKDQVPEYNRLLDCGAAVQNMLLMAHALGLGAVWITLSPQEVETLRARYNVPGYVSIVTSLAAGWPATTPAPPARMDLEDVVLRA
jgi:nitroreductase